MRRQRLNLTQKADWRSVVTIALALPILIVLLLFLYFRPTEQTTTLQEAVIATGEYPPFSGESLESYGIASAIVVQTMKEIGYESQLTFMPWPLVDTSTRESETNRGVRAAFPFVKTSEREKAFYFSDPIIEVETSVFYNKERTPNIVESTSLRELQDYKLLPIEGYRYLPAVDRLPKLEKAAKNNVKAFEALINDPQVQLVAESTAVGQQILSENFPRQQYVIKSLPAFTSPLYLIASRRNPYNRELIMEFNKALASIDEQQRQQITQTVMTQLEQRNQVLLNTSDDSGYIRGYFRPNADRSVLLPKGSKAVVVQWPESYLREDKDIPIDKNGAEDRLVWAQVRILNGPLRQEILYVDSRTIELP